MNKANLLLRNQKTNIISESEVFKNANADCKKSPMQKVKRIRARIVHQPQVSLGKEQRYF